MHYEEDSDADRIQNTYKKGINMHYEEHSDADRIQNTYKKGIKNMNSTKIYNYQFD